MIQLNIRYDPEFEGMGFDPPAQEEYLSRHFPPDKPPRFPIRGNVVSALGLEFRRTRHHFGGPDPYSGERWTLKLGDPRGRLGQLELVLGDIVCCEATVDWVKYGDDPRRPRMPAGHRQLHRSCELSWKDMPLAWRRLWDFLEYRHEWWEHNTPDWEDGGGWR